MTQGSPDVWWIERCRAVSTLVFELLARRRSRAERATFGTREFGRRHGIGRHGLSLRFFTLNGQVSVARLTYTHVFGE